MPPTTASDYKLVFQRRPLNTSSGSLVARIFFQPVEEISRVYFSKTLSVCTIEQDEGAQKPHHSPDNVPSAKAKAGKGPPAKQLTPDNVPSAKATAGKGPPAKQLTPVQRNALLQASSTLNTLLLLQSHLLLILITFLPPYLPTLLSHFLPKKYLDTSAPSILQAYAYYLPMMSLNGLMEAFAFSVMSPADVRIQTRWLFATSVCFGLSVWVFSNKLGLGEVGLVYANVASLGMRMAWAAAFSDGWFEKMWARGAEDEREAAEQEKQSSSSPVSPPGISIRQILPPRSVLLLFAVSSQIVRYTQAWFVLDSRDLLQRPKDRALLIAQAQHVAVGGFLALLCLAECYRSQRAHVRILISLIRSRP